MGLDIDFTEVNPLLLSTVEVLEVLRSESGCNISRFLSQVPSQPSLDSSGLWIIIHNCLHTTLETQPPGMKHLLQTGLGSCQNCLNSLEPIHVFRGVVKIFKHAIQDILKCHTSYTHHTSTKEFQQSIAEVIADELVGQVKGSGVFSVMLDESTDVSVHQNCVVYVKPDLPTRLQSPLL
jgi:hypothetical protein